MLQFFREFNKIVGELGASFVALIPGGVVALLIKHFRPISLVGSLYKILAKVLSNRLRRVLIGGYFRISKCFCEWSSNPGVCVCYL